MLNATDAYVNGTNDDRKARNYGTAVDLYVGPNREAYVYFNRPGPLGATYLPSTLRLVLWTAYAGGNIIVERVAGSWKQSRLTWNNKPGVTGAAITVAVPALAAGAEVEVNVAPILQAVSAGAGWYGFRIRTDGANVARFGSSNARDRYRPSLDADWSDAPAAPTTLRPSGGRAVGLAKPVLSFDTSEKDLAAIEVQVAAASDFVDAWSSGIVLQDYPELDLAGTTYPGLADGATAWWKVRVRDGSGLWSEWSDPASFIRDDLAAVTITNPAAGANPFVSEPTPRITWEAYPGQVAWEAIIRDPDDPTVEVTSGKRNGTDNGWTVPSNVLKKVGKRYRAVVRVWDNVDREAAGGTVYATAFRDFVVQTDATITPVNSLTVGQDGPVPVARLRWDRGTAADSYVIRRAGDVIADSLLPEDLLETGTTYGFTDPAAEPWRTHTWSVAAVVNGKESEPVSVTGTVKGQGIWIVHPTDPNGHVWLADREGSVTQAEEATVFAPVGAANVVRRVQAQRGYEGGFSGRLVDRYGVTGHEYERRLLALRTQPDLVVTVIVSDLAIRARIGNPRTTITHGIPPVRVGSFDCWEVLS